MNDSVFDLSPKRSKKKRQKKLKKAKKLIAAAIVVSAAVCGFVGLMNHCSSMIVSLCNAKVQSLAMSAVNSAIIETMSGSIKYSDLVMVEKDGNGDIALLETNSVLINRLARDTAKKSEENLAGFADSKIAIPLGQLSGTPLLSNLGPEITVRLLPYSYVNCVFLSEFEAAGINQTRHKIFMNVVANVDLILPASQKTITTVAEVLVCESLLVGKVPEIYLNMGNFGGNLDLTP